MTTDSPLRRSSLPISVLVHDEDEHPVLFSLPVIQNLRNQCLPLDKSAMHHQGPNPPTLLSIDTQELRIPPDIPLYNLCIFNTSSASNSPIYHTPISSSPVTIPAISSGSVSVISNTSSDTDASSPASIFRNRHTHRARPTCRSSLHRLKVRSKPLAPRRAAERILKGPWKPAETALLSALVAEHGANRWTHIARHIPGRTGKQARERWKNHLDPELKKGGWTAEEDAIILKMFRRVGKKWSTIARQIPGRSDNDVKNRYNGALTDQKEKVAAQGNRAENGRKLREKEGNVGCPVRRVAIFEESEAERPSMFNMY